jgi:hypothetical protein
MSTTSVAIILVAAVLAGLVLLLLILNKWLGRLTRRQDVPRPQARRERESSSPRGTPSGDSVLESMWQLLAEDKH